VAGLLLAWVPRRWLTLYATAISALLATALLLDRTFNDLSHAVAWLIGLGLALLVTRRARPYHRRPRRSAPAHPERQTTTRHRLTVPRAASATGEATLGPWAERRRPGCYRCVQALNVLPGAVCHAVYTVLSAPVANTDIAPLLARTTVGFVAIAGPLPTGT
jgi:hypothetical protein